MEELDRKINEERVRISELVEKIKTGRLISNDTLNKEALDELGKVKKKYDETVKKITQFKGY